MRKVLSLSLTILLSAFPAFALQDLGGKVIVGGKAILGGGGVAAGITWTVVQHPNKFTCSNSGASGSVSCTMTVTSTTAGNALVFASALFWGSTNGNQAPTSVSATGNSGDTTFTHCPNGYASEQYSTHNYENVDCYYIASATGGATSVTFTWTLQSAVSATDNIDIEFIELHRSSGTPVIDTTNNAVSASCSSCTAPTLTLSGTSDAIVQFIASPNAISSISGSYTNPTDIDSTNVLGAFAGAMNQSSGTGPTWTVTTGGVAMGGIAFK
jgi:hypothetical protein